MNTRLLSACTVLAHLLLLASGTRGQVYEKVFSFADRRIADLQNSSGKGRSPDTSLVEGRDGFFYGTTTSGGTSDNNGTIFRMDASGKATTLVEFTYDGTANRGATPEGALVQGSDGNFYGTTRYGGMFQVGTLFKMTPAGVLTTLVDFDGSTMGSEPRARLTVGPDGNLYGTTAGTGNGSVFVVTPAGAFTTLVEFTGNGGSYRGSRPLAGLTLGSDGNLYGTTNSGGLAGNGTIFKLTPAGVFTTLVDFTGDDATGRGAYPDGELVQGFDGNFYGTTYDGGATGEGSVFKMTPAGVLTKLAEFDSHAPTPTGVNPIGRLVQAGDGSLYGVTEFGAVGPGTIFKVTPAGELITLVEFTGGVGNARGSRPVDGLILASDGYLYGTTHNGGAYDAGTAFRISDAGALTTLVDFTYHGVSETGSIPVAGLVEGHDGALYGTTYAGGFNEVGTVYKITPAGQLTTLKTFRRNDPDGDFPSTRLLKASDGNFYGTTSDNPTNALGTIFQLTPAGQFTTMVTFTGDSGPAKGDYCGDGLVEGDPGVFYGTTTGGGATGAGTVFKVTAAGDLTTLVEFTGNGGTKKGSAPNGALVRSSTGDFYGTTSGGGTSGYGTIFRMTPQGVLTTLVQFTGTGGGSPGSRPKAGLVLGSDGNFYGTTEADGYGSVFKVTPAGVLTTLVHFAYSGPTNAGAFPNAALVQAPDGNLYGTTPAGGANDLGTIFRITSGGALTTIFNFAPDPVEARPMGALVVGDDGNLYGAASNGPGNPLEDSHIFRVLLPGAPSVYVLPLSGQGTTSATLKAQVNARGAVTTVSLEYGTDGNAFTSLGPVSGALAGFDTTLVGASLPQLQPGTTYYFRFRAVSSAGTTISPVATFSTLIKPSVASQPASAITPGSAQFNGVVNARSYDTTVSFEWGTDGNNFPNSVAAVPATVTGMTDVVVSKPVAGLIKGLTYFYRVVATNAAGTATSGVQSFITLTDPIVTIGGATPIDAVSATVSGSVDARGASTTAVFEYSTNPGFTASLSTPVIPSPITGVGPTPVSGQLLGLAPGTTYYCRIVATSAGGTASSGVATFATPARPEVTGQMATNIGTKTATLNASVDANGVDTTVLFEYGLTQNSLPFSVTASPGSVSGHGATSVSAAISGLPSDAQVYFRVRATSSAGETLTSPLNFTTAASATVGTGAAKDIALGSATFTGIFNAVGQPTAVEFIYGTDPANLTQAVAAGSGTLSGTSDTNLEGKVTGLTLGAHYFVRARATNADGTTLARNTVEFDVPNNVAPVANLDTVFYSRSVTFNPLINDTDANNLPPTPANAGLTVQQIVQVPQVAAGVATVVGNERQFIGYTPQFNVINDDSLTYRVVDAQGATADGVVRLVTFAKRAGSYGASLGTRGVIVLEFDGSGSVTVGSVSWQATSTGTLGIYRIKGIFDSGGRLRVSPSIPGGTLEFVLQIDPDMARLTGSVTERDENGAVTTSIDPIELRQNAGTGGLAESGLRTAFLEAPADMKDQLGAGYLLLNVSKNGRSARVTGRLPDGQRFGAGSKAAGTIFPLMAKVSPAGSVVGNVRVVRMGGNKAGMMGTLAWQRAADSRLRTAVATTLEMHGVEYPLLGRNALPPIALGTGTPNARLIFSGGDFATPLEFPLMITAAGVSGFDPQMLKLKLQPSLGTFSGKFRDPLTGRLVPFDGALRTEYNNEPGQGRGVFIGRSAAGAVSILPPSP